MFSLFHFSSVFQRGSADRICPYVRTPMGANPIAKCLFCACYRQNAILTIWEYNCTVTCSLLTANYCTKMVIISGMLQAKSGTPLGPRTCTTLGDRSFAVAGPRVWNSLPATIGHITSYGQFRQHLKTHLFILEIAAHCDSVCYTILLPTYLLAPKKVHDRWQPQMWF